MTLCVFSPDSRGGPGEAGRVRAAAGARGGRGQEQPARRPPAVLRRAPRTPPGQHPRPRDAARAPRSPPLPSPCAASYAPLHQPLRIVFRSSLCIPLNKFKRLRTCMGHTTTLVIVCLKNNTWEFKYFISKSENRGNFRSPALPLCWWRSPGSGALLAPPPAGTAPGCVQFRPGLHGISQGLL